jgi:DnaK suppressor protein
VGLSEAQRDELRRDLDDLARELRAALDGSAEAARPVELDQAAVGRVSRIDSIQQQKMLEASRRAQDARLVLVQSALRRFEEDEYGDCLDCGDGVAYGRLKARPETLFCIGCQSAREPG